MSLCRPERSCSVLLVLRMDRLWDFLFCLAWRAAALLPLSTGIPPFKLDATTDWKYKNHKREADQRAKRTDPVFFTHCKASRRNPNHCQVLHLAVVLFGSFHVWMCEMTKWMSVKQSVAQRARLINPTGIETEKLTTTSQPFLSAPETENCLCSIFC